MESADGSSIVMTHRQILQAISGLLLASFAVGLSATIMANALPHILAELNGRQGHYTWVITGGLIANASSALIWGKFSDRMSKKLLVQVSISIFAGGGILAGFSPNTESLIAFRVVQGVGAGGMMALLQIVLASLISPRQRGRYMGYFSAAGAAAIVGGPPLGGLIVDIPFLGWRWCFWVGAPIAVLALILLQKTLRLPLLTANTKVDWMGALLIPGGIAVLLIWISVAGDSFDWFSLTSAATAGTGLILVGLAVVAERRVADPVVSPRLMRRRLVRLAVITSISIGIVMAAASVFLAQYFQIARGFTPTESGLLSLPMVAGMVVATTVSGRLVTRTGRWKRFLVAGATMTTAGMASLSVVERSTSLVFVSACIAAIGLGAGASLPHVIVAVQNGIAYRDLGSGTATLTFFQTLGTAAGLSALGATYTSTVTSMITRGLPFRPEERAVLLEGGGTSLDMSRLDTESLVIVQQAHSDAAGTIFQITAAVAAVAIVAVLFMRETPLRGS